MAAVHVGDTPLVRESAGVAGECEEEHGGDERHQRDTPMVECTEQKRVVERWMRVGGGSEG